MSEYLIEEIIVGNALKVTAVDPETGLEAVIQAPLTGSRLEARQLAVRKLLYLIEKKKK
ncbi:MAG: hypothetical protein J0L97_04425 [Alphaproteobacteria bacterium]|nr:hypothetical protein [Alphaproteobacteria bacterium]